MLNKITRTLGLAALLAAAAPVAQAGVMTFTSLVSNTNYSEAGLTMTSTSVWMRMFSGGQVSGRLPGT